MLFISIDWEIGQGWGQIRLSHIKGNHRGKPVSVCTRQKTHLEVHLITEQQSYAYCQSYIRMVQSQELECVKNGPVKPQTSFWCKICLIMVSIQSNRAWVILPRRIGKNIRSKCAKLIHPRRLAAVIAGGSTTHCWSSVWILMHLTFVSQ